MEKEDLRVWAVQLKGQEQNESFGFNQYIWLTDKQVENVMNIQNDDERKNDLIMAGNVAFKIKDITSMRRLRVSECKNFASFDRNVITRALAESEPRQRIAENAAGKARLEEMKKKLLDNKTRS